MSDIVEQRILQNSLVVRFGDSRKSKAVRVFGELLRQPTIGIGQSELEVGQRLSLSLVQVGCDEVQEHGSAPTVFLHLAYVEQGFVYIAFHFIQNQFLMSQGTLNNPYFMERESEISISPPAWG